jgi:CheY-like chemotaxis protein
MPQPRILVIDDADATRRWVANLLRRHGYEVTEAANGRTGLAALREHPDTSVIVLDLLMEEGSGWWFREQQLADAATAAVPVIILSIAPASEPVRYTLRAHQMLHKVPEPDELLSAVERACALRQSVQSP